MTMIKFSNVSFIYPGANKESVKDINLSVDSGEVIVFAGRSGCGKTTMTRLVNGLIPNFFEGRLTGRIEIAGSNIEELSMKKISGMVGSVFQDPRSQFFTMEVGSELVFSCENHAIDRETIIERVDNTIENLDIANLQNRRLVELSSGEKQKVAIASVHTMRSSIYVLDEPSANLDHESTQQLYGLLKYMKEEGNTIIISEHKLYYLRELIDRMVYMENGRISEILTRKKLVTCSPDFLTEHGLRQLDLKYALRVDKENGANSFAKAKGKSDFELELQDLAFGFKRNNYLWSDVNMHFFSGEIIGIIGQNGVGKSTLVRIMMGLNKQKNGEIFHNKRIVKRKQRLSDSAFVMQDVDYQLFASSVWEEMKLSQLGEVNEDKIRYYLQELSLFELKDRHPASLSGGEKQRLALAIACLRESRVIYLDEPTSGLDAANMKKVSDILRDMARKGHLIYVITHDYEFAVNTVSRYILLQDGKISSKNIETLAVHMNIKGESIK